MIAILIQKTLKSNFLLFFDYYLWYLVEARIIIVSPATIFSAVSLLVIVFTMLIHFIWLFELLLSGWIS